MHKLLLENIVLWGNNDLVFRLKLVNFQETTVFLHRFTGLKKNTERERKREGERNKKGKRITFLWRGNIVCQVQD